MTMFYEDPLHKAFRIAKANWEKAKEEKAGFKSRVTCGDMLEIAKLIVKGFKDQNNHSPCEICQYNRENKRPDFCDLEAMTNKDTQNCVNGVLQFLIKGE